MNQYKYRLTVTFSSIREWKLGVETKSIGEAVAREIARNAGDVQHCCLSLEKTGEVFWLRPRLEFNS